MSWAGKILRVDLTAGTVKSEPLKMDWARQYIGSRGLASKYLISEIDPKVDPLPPFAGLFHRSQIMSHMLTAQTPTIHTHASGNCDSQFHGKGCWYPEINPFPAGEFSAHSGSFQFAPACI